MKKKNESGTKEMKSGIYGVLGLFQHGGLMINVFLAVQTTLLALIPRQPSRMKEWMKALMCFHASIS